MKATLHLAAIVSLALGGSAFADHGHGGGGHGGGGGGPVIRDHRGGGGGGGGGGGERVVVRDRGRPGGGPVIRDHRGGYEHVRVSNGRYVFPGGVVRVYRRPVIRTHYYDVHVRPAVIVEQYDPVPGYMWVSGGWAWGGGEWVWNPGYWAAAEEPVVAAPVVSGGVSVSAGVSF